MINVTFLYYNLNGVPVVIGMCRDGQLIELHVNGVDYSDDGQMEHDVTRALMAKGINLQEDITKAFSKADDRALSARVVS